MKTLKLNKWENIATKEENANHEHLTPLTQSFQLYTITATVILSNENLLIFALMFSKSSATDFLHVGKNKTFVTSLDLDQPAYVHSLILFCTVCQLVKEGFKQAL